MRLLGIILLPFTFLYSVVVRLRNHLYNIGYSRSFDFEIPIILVGNLSAGGSGKTPMIEYLVRLLINKYQLAILSRGYKRKTKGFRIALESDSSLSIGDEPKQYFDKWKDDVVIAVGEDRAEAIPKILFEAPKTNTMLMDDGFQHRSVRSKLSIVTTEYSSPFYEDFLLPSGRLREPRKEIKRADVVVITKCPHDLSKERMAEMKERVGEYAEDLPLFFSRIDYLEPVPLYKAHEEYKPEAIIVVSAIANPLPFESYVGSKWGIVKSIRFPDHHKYNLGDIRVLRRELEVDRGMNTAIFVTEKDAAKLNEPELKSQVKDLPIFYIPIEMVFIENGANFDSLLLRTAGLV